MQNDHNLTERADAYARNVSPYFNIEDKQENIKQTNSLRDCVVRSVMLLAILA